eukprot:CAMPEP_0185191272 /NCGR_PEP_ID=MMETSP1140-20130426/15158_1 /TAXON_ID=298111 /ORGANISM="Pavlova sp., Strain CCMP459" /LENGTH=125 /DNA_ID=CAMNT_0027757969 /DNA_START=63 /DNA_END=441 /DNA_ORIENTATION=-
MYGKFRRPSHRQHASPLGPQALPRAPSRGAAGCGVDDLAPLAGATHVAAQGTAECAGSSAPRSAAGGRSRRGRAPATPTLSRSARARHLAGGEAVEGGAVDRGLPIVESCRKVAHAHSLGVQATC